MSTSYTRPAWEAQPSPTHVVYGRPQGGRGAGFPPPPQVSLGSARGGRRTRNSKHDLGSHHSNGTRQAAQAEGKDLSTQCRSAHSNKYHLVQTRSDYLHTEKPKPIDTGADEHKTHAFGKQNVFEGRLYIYSKMVRKVCEVGLKMSLSFFFFKSEIECL